jgi:hypothetical protein
MPVVFGLQGLHAGQQQPYVILLVNINSLECNLLRTSKPWPSAIGSPNFMLTPLSNQQIAFLHIAIFSFYMLFWYQPLCPVHNSSDGLVIGSTFRISNPSKQPLI